MGIVNVTTVTQHNVEISLVDQIAPKYAALSDEDLVVVSLYLGEVNGRPVRRSVRLTYREVQALAASNR